MDKAKKIIVENAIKALQAVLEIFSTDSEKDIKSEHVLSLDKHYDMNDLKDDIIQIYNSQIKDISYEDIIRDLSNMINTEKLNILDVWMLKSEKGELWKKIPIGLRYSNIQETITDNIEYIAKGIQLKRSGRRKDYGKR